MYEKLTATERKRSVRLNLRNNVSIMQLQFNVLYSRAGVNARPQLHVGHH